MWCSMKTCVTVFLKRHAASARGSISCLEFPPKVGICFLPSMLILHALWISQILTTGVQRRPSDWPENLEHQAAGSEMYKKNADEPYDEGALEKLARMITPTSGFWTMFEPEFHNGLQPDERKQGRPPYFFDP